MVGGEEKREKTWQLTKKFYSFKVRVAAPMYDAMLWVLESGAYLNLSEYTIDLIQEDLKERGIKMEAIEVGDEEEATKRRPPTETAVVSARVPIPLTDAIDRVLDSGPYLRASDYLRHIIRKDLEGRGLLPEPKVEVEP